MHSRLLALGLIASLSIAASPEQEKYERIEPSPKQLKQLNALTPESVAQAVTVEDEELEPIIMLTTANAYKSNGAFTDRVRSDNFFRAFITKATGAVHFQLYQQVTYSFDRREFRNVSFMTDDGLVTSEVTPIAQELVGCQYGMCTYRDIVGLALTAEQMREIAAKYVAGASPLWRFRFQSRTGFDWEDRISPAEAAGLLLAVERRTGDKPPAQ